MHVTSQKIGKISLRFQCSRGQLKCDGTRAKTRFRLSAKRTSPFKSAGASVQSTTGSRGVRISGSNAGYTMFRGSVKSIGYPLHSPVSPSFPLPCITVCHTFHLEFNSGFSWSRNLIHFVTVLIISNWCRTYDLEKLDPPAAWCSNFWECCNREQKHWRCQFSSSSGKVRWWCVCCSSWRSI